MSKVTKAQVTKLAAKQGQTAQAQLRGKLPEIKPRTVLGSVAAYLRDMRRPSAATRATTQTFRRIVAAAKGINLANFGIKSAESLAAKFLALMERIEAERLLLKFKNATLTSAERVARAKGLVGVFAGELFELLVHHHLELHVVLRREALKQLQEMVLLATSDEKRLNDLVVNSLGNRADAKPVFERLQKSGVLKDLGEKGAQSAYLKKATNLWTDDGTGKKKFTDFAYVVSFKDGDDHHVFYLVGVEIKLPRAARQFPEQIASMESRFRSASVVLMEIDGEQLVLDPEKILFARSVGSVVYGIRPTSDPLGGSYFSPARSPSRALTAKTETVFNAYRLPLDVTDVRKMASIPFTLVP